MNTDDIEIKLVEIISFEIQQDGGASLVRDLKDYNLQIDSLLKKRCTIYNTVRTPNISAPNTKNKKLLSFLECHPSVFEVDRDALPHVVYLISSDYSSSDNSGGCNDDCRNEASETYTDTSTHVSIKRMQKVKEDLKDRIMCVIKKEHCKNQRRNKNTIDTDICKIQNDDNGKSNEQQPFFSSSVNSIWLQKQCKYQIHHYLRLSGYYKKTYTHCKDVKIIGCNAWVDLVKSEFLSFVNDTMTGLCQVKNGRIFLLQREEEDDDLNELNNAQNIAMKLKEKVEEDGGTHISLSLLLHRHPDLCKLLSGRDIMKMKTKYNQYFNGINIYIKNKNNVFLQSKTTKINGRMEVDETGLFSVASSKWGNAFASIMSSHCRKVLDKEPNESIAIDLTASVGGVTLPLAKIFWKVIAVEIDEHRAILCRKNMQNFGVMDRVKIVNDDSVEIIPKIARDFVIGQSKVVIIDPPWGGMHYKHEQKEIMMGQWSMLQVVSRVSEYLTPTIIGLRMPLSYDVETFFQSLISANVTFNKLEVKKAGPQLFMVLSV